MQQRRWSLLWVVLAAALVIAPGSASAFNQSPFLNLGNTGSLDGVLPPPGVYLSLYNVYYTADDFKDGDGNNLPMRNKIDLVATVPQFYYISDKKLFGATPGIQAMIGLFGMDVDSDLGIESGRSGFSDLIVGPFIGSSFKPTTNSVFFWNLELDTYFPIGRYDNDKAINPSSNYWTIEPWLNFTWLMPHGFEITSRLHYTYNFKNTDFGSSGDQDLKAGQLFHFNYVITKTVLSDNFRLGAQGYYLKQLNEDELDGVDIPNSKEQVFAIGPTAVWLHKGTYFSLSGMWESAVENRADGFKTVFRIVYKF